MKRFVAFFATALLCQSCASPVIETTTERISKSDAPVLGYYLPKAVIPITVSLDGLKKALVVSYSSTPNIVPDLKNKYFIRFNHEPLSSDQFTVSAPDGLLEKVSTTASDNTAVAIEGINTVLENYKKIETAMSAQGFDGEDNKSDDELCNGAKAILTLDFTNPKSPQTEDLNKIVNCSFKATLHIDPASSENLFPASAKTEIQAKTDCPNCLFFRVSRPYRVKLHVYLVKGSVPDPQYRIDNSFTVMAPDMDTIAYAQFKRHPFVESSQTLEFNKGVLKGINVNRPSDVVGFLKVPAAGLATAIAIKSLD
ncbi:hypothetical protein ACQZ6B_02875 [Agrobacterium vitis]